jgi:hypothetical protein
MLLNRKNALTASRNALLTAAISGKITAAMDSAERKLGILPLFPLWVAAFRFRYPGETEGKTS